MGMGGGLDEVIIFVNICLFRSDLYVTRLPPTGVVQARPTSSAVSVTPSTCNTKG